MAASGTGAERVSATTVARAVLLAAALVAAGLLLTQLFTLLLGLFISVIIALPLAAFAGRLERAGVPRAVGVPLGALAALAVVGGVCFLVIPAFVDETRKFINQLP